MDVEKKEIQPKSVSVKAVAKLRLLYRIRGFLVNQDEAKQDLLWRFKNSVPASPEILDGVVEQNNAYQYFFESVGFWPCLIEFDPQNNQIVGCWQLGEWPIFFLTSHAIARFVKYSARTGQCYVNNETAFKEMMFRLIRSQKTGVEIFPHGQKKEEKYPDSVYGIEKYAGVKFPLVFALVQTKNKKSQPGFLVITCYLFMGRRISVKKTRTRAEEKRVWRKLLNQINYGEEEE